MFKAFVIGNLGRDPETRYTPSGAMNVSFSVAASTKRGGEEHTEWVRCTCWNKLGEIAESLSQSGALCKGKQVFVLGQVTTAAYVGKDGKPGYSVDLRVDDLQLLGKKGEDGESTPVDANGRTASDRPRRQADSYEPDDVPF